MNETTDCQLIELAAKAAGIKALRDPYGAWRDCTNCVPLMNIFSAPTWNPLIDDGDALRLAVKLEIEVRGFNGKAHAGKQDKFWCTEKWFPDADSYAATRRAITRAAAEIGKSMT